MQLLSQILKFYNNKNGFSEIKDLHVQCSVPVTIHALLIDDLRNILLQNLNRAGFVSVPQTG